MNEIQIKNDELCAKIQEALTFLDQKGTNENVTQSLTIVYEGFRRQASRLPFTANDLILTALAPQMTEHSVKTI